MPSEIDIGVVKQALNKRLWELRQSTRSTVDSRKPVELDQAAVGRLSRVDALQMQAMAQAAEHRRSQEIGRVHAALKRIDEGEFGFCISCGEAIPPDRLAIDPTISTCIRCASGAVR